MIIIIFVLENNMKTICKGKIQTQVTTNKEKGVLNRSVKKQR